MRPCAVVCATVFDCVHVVKVSFVCDRVQSVICAAVCVSAQLPTVLHYLYFFAVFKIKVLLLSSASGMFLACVFKLIAWAFFSFKFLLKMFL